MIYIKPCCALPPIETHPSLFTSLVTGLSRHHPQSLPPVMEEAHLAAGGMVGVAASVRCRNRGERRQACCPSRE